MPGARVTADRVPELPEWRRTTAPAELVGIFEPGVQVCTWQRRIDPQIGCYLAGLPQTHELQVFETLPPASRPRLDCLPEGAGWMALRDDVAQLAELIGDLLGCETVGLRLARVGRAMCPGWHVDRVGIRLVCTYQGPGTQWLDDQAVDRRCLPGAGVEAGGAVAAEPGEVVLLKGSLWQGNQGLGAIHRSPDLASPTSLRTLITLDPLWNL